MSNRRDCELWFLELSEFLDLCESATEPDQQLILSRLFVLISLSPPEWAHLFEPMQQRSAFDAMVASSAFTSAAISLLGGNNGYFLSRSPDGQALASVWLAKSKHEIHARASTEAIALATAFASSIFAVVGEEVKLDTSVVPRFGQ